MTAAWPGSINQNVRRPSYNEQMERNIVDFKPETGPPKERRRTSISTEILTFDQRYTKAEWAALKAFYRDTLGDGTLPFTRLHPLDETSQKFKFTEPPKLKEVRVLSVIVSHSLRRMP